MTSTKKKIACIIFRCCFSLYFIGMYMYWCLKHSTPFPKSVSDQLIDCQTTRRSYMIIQLFIIIFFIWLFCIENPFYFIIAVCAILVFVFDIRNNRYAHFAVAILYILTISVAIIQRGWWFILLIPLLVATMTRNLCATEVAFLSLMVWFI